MRRHFILIVLALSGSLLCMGGIGRANEHDSTVSTAVFGPSLRSVQVDGTIFFFTAAYSGSVDVDFLQFKAGRRSSLGLRAGIEYFETGGVGGRTGGSPYLDYNVLLRSTLSGESLRFDAFLGYTRHTSDLPQYYPAKNLVKYGIELRWKIAPGVFGLLAKVNGTKSAATVGIGLYLGWD